MFAVKGQELGFGLGLRSKHIDYIIQHKPQVDWFEIISENYMDTGGKPRRNLDALRAHYPVVMHGVALSIGTVDPLDSMYLQKLKALIADIQPAWITDHLCWTGIAHKTTHDLLPVPYTEEALNHIVERIQKVQDYLGCAIGLENPSTYLEFKSSNIPEAEFIARMAEKSGCHLLLDINNVYVTCYNHKIDPKKYIDTLPLDKVVQIHLAGHSNKGAYIVDTHDGPVIDDVWNLYKYTLNQAGRVPNTMIEWDDKIPDFPILYQELEKARAAAADAHNHIIPTLPVESKRVSNVSTPLEDEQITLQSAIFKGQSFALSPQEWILEKKNFTPQEQLDVYIKAYRYRLLDVVQEDYPALKTYLGDALFNDCLWAFVNEVQPDHFNIARYALKFPEFFKKIRPDDRLGYELVMLETWIFQLSDYPETKQASAADFQDMDVQTLLSSPLPLRAALKLFQFEFPVNSYYEALIEGQPLEDIQQQASYTVVFRHDDTVWRMRLDAQEYDLLDQLLTGSTIGEALTEIEDVSPSIITQWFSRWQVNGLLAA